MDMPKIMMTGFNGLPIDEPFITAAENKKNTKVVIDDWMLYRESVQRTWRKQAVLDGVGQGHAGR